MAAGLGWPDAVMAKITPQMTSLPGFETILISDRLRLDQVHQCYMMQSSFFIKCYIITVLNFFWSALSQKMAF